MWDNVNSETISRCFRRAGVLNDDLDVVDRGIEGESDPSRYSQRIARPN